MAKVKPIPDGYPQVRPYLCIDGAADVSAHQTKTDAQHHGDDHGCEAHDQRQARAIHNRAENVATLIVGAQREGPIAVARHERRRLQTVAEAEGGWIERRMRCQHGRQKRHEHDEQGSNGGNNGQ